LQRQVGNNAVAALIGGRHAAPAPVSGAPNLVTIARSPATDAIAAIDNPAGADIKDAFDKLTPLAMFDLLPTLLTIEIHEAEHAAHTLALQKKYGGKTAAFQKVWDSADDWWRDEVRAYGTEIPFYEKVVAAIKKLEKLKSP